MRRLRTLSILLAASLAAGQPILAQNDAWYPDLLTGMVADCITDPGVNPKYSEPPDVDDFGVGMRPCDEWITDVLERPTIQQPEDDVEKYYAWIDIDTAWFGLDATWLYVGIGIRGLLEGTTMDAKPMFELDFEPDGRGDFLVIHEGGSNPEDFKGTFSHPKAVEKLSMYSDSDESVGGSKPDSAEGAIIGNGYDMEEWKTGQDPTDGCAVRQVTRVSGLPRFDFACRRAIVGDPPPPYSIRVTINRGSNDPQNFYLHDKYTNSSYGAPYEDDPDFNSGNTYEIDNTPWITGIQLPVEIGGIEAIRDESGLLLGWTTASESNNAGFEVQHSLDADSFERVGFVGGAGTTNDAKSYTFRLKDERPGLHRFRLKQIDFDGAFSFSPTVEVAVDVPGRFVLEPAYPNPFNPTTTVRFGVAVDEIVSLKLYDMLGRMVKVLFEDAVDANQMLKVSLNGDGLPSGNYVVRLEGGSFTASRMITLAK